MNSRSNSSTSSSNDPTAFTSHMNTTSGLTQSDVRVLLQTWRMMGGNLAFIKLPNDHYFASVAVHDTTIGLQCLAVVFDRYADSRAVFGMRHASIQTCLADRRVVKHAAVIQDAIR